jgi:hypothetical protein
MNNIQSAVARHLLDPNGSSARHDALSILTREGFFAHLDSQETSETVLAAFVQEYGPNGNGSFCDGGIGRLYEAIGLALPGQVEPGPQESDVFVNFTLTVHRDLGLPVQDSNGDVDDEEYKKLRAIIEKLPSALGLIQGEGWKLVGISLRDWDLD